jgi:two-component system phosphate regulon response regulator PhoB
VNPKLKKETILVVEDEKDVAELVCLALGRANFETLVASSGYEGVCLSGEKRPTAIILDIMLSRMDGFEVIKRLKADPRTSDIPVIILSAKTELESRIHGFELGADDYIPKPFSPHELVLRLRAVLRRRNTLMEVLVAGPLIVDPIALKVTLNGRSLDLSLLEFKLLSVLMCRAGDILSREELLRAVWGDDASVTKRVVDTNIYRLREKLKDSGDMMKTVRCLGYLFTIPERAA